VEPNLFAQLFLSTFRKGGAKSIIFGFTFFFPPLEKVESNPLFLVLPFSFHL